MGGRIDDIAVVDRRRHHAAQQWPAAAARRETSLDGDGLGSTQAAAPAEVHLIRVAAGRAVEDRYVPQSHRRCGQALPRREPRRRHLHHYQLRAPVGGTAGISVADAAGKVVRTLRGTNEAEINRVRWNLRADPPPPPPGAQQGRGGQGGGPQQGPAVAPGTYVVKLSAGGKDLTQIVVVEEDRWLIR